MEFLYTTLTGKKLLGMGLEFYAWDELLAEDGEYMVLVEECEPVDEHTYKVIAGEIVGRVRQTK